MVCFAGGWRKGVSVFLRWTDLLIISIDVVIAALQLAADKQGRRKKSKIMFNLQTLTDLF